MRPQITLFMLSSVDGKISTGASDKFDFDKDFPSINGVKEGLQQYYDIELTTELWSLNSGRVQEKMGVNVKPMPNKTPVSFVLIDNNHLQEHGCRYFCHKSDKFVLITSNRNHPGFAVEKEVDNFDIIYQRELNLNSAMEILYGLGCKKITLQTGGTLNSIFLREGLLDYIDIVVAPILVGGGNVPTIIDGDSITNLSQLNTGVLKLESCDKLKSSYIRLRYKVIK